MRLSLETSTATEGGITVSCVLQVEVCWHGVLYYLMTL